MSSIPSYDKFMLPILKIHKDKEVHHLPDNYDELANQFGISDQERHEMLESGRQTRFKNRIGWARTYLKKAGLLEIVSPGKTKITERGIEVLGEELQDIDVSYLNQFSEFVEFRRGSKKNDSVEMRVADKDSPEDYLEEGYRQIRNQLETDLLEKIQTGTYTFFEQLVVDLLIQLGYGGSKRDAGSAIGKSGDNGIDGIIKEDRLGLDVIYLQAKKWKNTVGRPDVQAFAGSLEGFRAKKGVFITTSDFSKDAIEYVTRIDKKIVLINGEELVRLMIDNNLGVNTVSKYEIKEIDLDYFEN
ncbi:MAG TPA: restriction endonuclease [Oligoflexia bacterium]|nr:restriction endonuclease [Oligoflexia bacterium]HMR24679.1 restriction endonuclease [Oligoflexia bacterium]